MHAQEVSDDEERHPFTKEFKCEAVRLWKSSGKPAAVVACELGLRWNHLYKWQLELKTHGDAAFPGKGGRAHSTDELPRLQRENARLREECDILKKAAVYFARESPQRTSSFRPISIELDGSVRSWPSVRADTTPGVAARSVHGCGPTPPWWSR